MTFAHPALLLLLLVLPLLAGLKVWGDRRAGAAAGRVASPRLLPQLLVPRGKGRDWWVLLLELGALGCFVVALARPQYGFLEEETGAGGRSLIVAIDTSRSMLTDDLKPSRLVRTQLAATDLVKRLRGDRVGLMPFAGSAFLYAPITPDIDALMESIDSLDTEIIPRGGSNLARPIDLALETFAKAGATGQQVLILFSDGENLEGTTLEAAQRARDKKMTIIAIGVGTQAGALIPDPEAPGGFYRDREGKPVISRLQREVLLSIANATGGLYLPLDENGVDDRRIDLILEKLERSAMKGKMTRKSLDRYRWPLAGGLLLLLASWLVGMVRRQREWGAPRAAVAAALVGALLGGPAGAEAAAARPAAEDLPEGNPWGFYGAGQYDAALQNFQKQLGGGAKGNREEAAALEFGRGASAYKKQDYDTAVDAFGSALLSDQLPLRARAHYNLGNAIYQRSAELARQAKPKTLAKLSFIDGLIRQLENGLENYQQASLLQPGDADIQANRDTADALIQKLRAIRKQMAEEQGQGKDKDKGKKKGKKGEGEPPGQGKGEGEEGEGGSGAEGEEPGEGSGPEGEKEKAAREKSNKDQEGKIGDQGAPKEPEEKPGDQPGDKEGEKPGEGEEGTNPEDEVNPETGFSAAEAKRQLDRLSDEDMKVRPRQEQTTEVRPLKDW